MRATTYDTVRICGALSDWTSQDFTDTSLSISRHGFKCLRTDPAEMAVSPDAIIEDLDVLGDIGHRHRSSSVDALLDPLLPQAAEKGFSHGVVPAVPSSTHAGFEVVCPAKAPPRIAAKLRPLIEVNQDMLRLASAHSHEERVQHEILSQRGLGGPADNAARVEVHHDGQIQPAFPCAHIGNVGDPSGIGPGTVHPRCSVLGVRSDVELLVCLGGR